LSKKNLFREVNSVGIAEIVAAQIQEIIMERHLVPGDKLPAERDLVLLMSVSRNAIREGIGKLVAKGLLETRKGRGTYVAEPTFNKVQESLVLLLQLNQVDLVQLCDVRLLIEPELAGIAASNHKSNDVAPMLTAYKKLRQARLDPSAHVLADLEFHNAIASLANHFTLQAVANVMQEPVVSGMIVGTRLKSAVDFSDKQHKMILDAIVSGNVSAARRAMFDHISYVRDYLTKHSTTNLESAGK
jgi:GntR family transcriptional repressor for pyruvate dehydrogenase complex